jgi:hypothetical protein
MKTTKLSKKDREVAESSGLTVEELLAKLASGEWVRCAECGYASAPEDLDGRGLCEGCSEDYDCPTYSEPYCTLGE